MQGYLNVVMGLNYIVDLLLLLGTDRWLGYRCAPGRTAFAAVIGGLHSGVCLLPRFHFLGNILWRVVILGVTGFAAYGFEPGAVRRSVLFTSVNLILSGVALGIRDGGFPLLLLGGGGIGTMYLLGLLGRINSDAFVPVELCRDGQTVRFFALRDTGNTLQDPVTGKPVLVVGADVGTRLLGISPEQFRDPVQAVASGQIRGLRLIPFHSVGCSGGLLMALRFENAKVGDHTESLMVAFAPQVLRRDGAFQALAGGAA